MRVYFFDFGFKPLQNEYTSISYTDSEMERILFKGFNGSVETSYYVLSLKNKFKINTVIETGTFQGDTTSFFINHFNNVHSIEIMEEKYNEVADKFAKENKKCSLHLGNSSHILTQILPNLKDEMILFYLDAHWGKEWPLKDELIAISQTHKNNCIIMIDDIKVPTRNDIPYDGYYTYDELLKKDVYYECSFDYVKEQIKDIYTNFELHYVIPKNVNSRAKLVIIPIKNT